VGVRRLELAEFRIFRAAEIRPEPEGTTVITGPNGSGKTSVLEALAYLGTRRSFRGAPLEAMVRNGAAQAVIRADIEGADSPTLVEAEIVPGGRGRTRVNRKNATSRAALADAAPCTVFSPEDLTIISGGPRGRREVLDDALALLDPEGARAADETERVLRQRAALLRQSGGRVTPEVATTLDVWDQRLADAGKVLVAAREGLVAELASPVGATYGRLAGSGDPAALALRYQRSWAGDLLDALGAARSDDLRRGVNTLGPHRDDVEFLLDGREARTHASQGEQRCAALAVRLGVHHLVRTKTSLVPTLLLDDVFSELDPDRCRALVAELPAGQALLTTASPLPAGIDVVRVLPVGTLERP
jgi:DNA replication and repair protein RecF